MAENTSCSRKCIKSRNNQRRHICEGPETLSLRSWKITLLNEMVMARCIKFCSRFKPIHELYMSLLCHGHRMRHAILQMFQGQRFETTALRYLGWEQEAQVQDSWAFRLLTMQNTWKTGRVSRAPVHI